MVIIDGRPVLVSEAAYTLGYKLPEEIARDGFESGTRSPELQIGVDLSRHDWRVGLISESVPADIRPIGLPTGSSLPPPPPGPPPPLNDDDFWSSWGAPKKKKVNKYSPAEYKEPSFGQLWEEFKNRQYCTLAESDRLHSRRASERSLLFHAKLYVFAEKHLVDSLKDLSLRKPHLELITFQLTSKSNSALLARLEYTYDNTAWHDSTDDELRKLVTHYVVSKRRQLLNMKVFVRCSMSMVRWLRTWCIR